MKAVFFLRHNNDIDHIVPVIYKWLSNETNQAGLIILTENKILNDFRLLHLQEKYETIQMFHIEKFYNEKYIIEKNRHKIFKILFKVVKIIKNWKAEHTNVIHSAINAVRLVKYFTKSDEKIAFIFDWINIESQFAQVKPIIDYARSLGHAVISLPHGDAALLDLYWKKNTEISTHSNDLCKNFDYVVVPNKYCTSRYKKYLDDDRIKILGSPRYNEYWIEIIQKIVPNYNLFSNDNSVKIVFFLRSMSYSIFWDEIVITIQLLFEVFDIKMILVPHPRSNKKDQIKIDNYFNSLKQNKNFMLIKDPVHASVLIKWADIILDIGNSTVYEAVKIKKPVLELEYLSSISSILSKYFSKSVVLCRDDLLKKIRELKNSDFLGFYQNDEFEKFNHDVIEQNRDPLGRYVEFIENCIKD